MHLRWISFSFGLDNLMRFSDCDIENKVKKWVKNEKKGCRRDNVIGSWLIDDFGSKIHFHTFFMYILVNAKCLRLSIWVNKIKGTKNFSFCVGNLQLPYSPNSNCIIWNNK